MRIYSFATLVALPFVAVAGVMLWMIYGQGNVDMTMYLIIPILILAMIYIMSPQLNWWWWKRNPPQLDPPIRKWLDSYSPFYNGLSDKHKDIFRKRLKLFILSKDFGAMGQERTELPEDIKGIVAHNAVQLTFQRPEFLFKNYERIVAYKHAFPSPQHKFLHTVETHKDDGVILYSLEHLIPGMLRRGEIYNIGMHGIAEAFISDHPKISFPKVDDITWDEIKQVGGFDKEQIENTTGFKDVDKLPVLITFYADFYAQMQLCLPEVAHRLNLIFSLYANKDMA